jgi:hypothetical protein
MRWTRAELRWRDVLLSAVLPAPRESLPALSSMELSAFWVRFESAAPIHLRFGFRAAVVLLGAVMPRLLGSVRSLAELNEDEREALVVRANRLPVFSSLMEVVKLVACLAYFADARVQATMRSQP